ncbi:LacI family DNA-binding transcriptional regulator [Parasphingorhabdus halotolerans]|uniref:LacI family transcriptional regulator n=1 Tax=Parasphingorhabdus halotolerans TaxID=2725558 RepID=A0A6H2DPK1_9SPHN|nr:LacI family DNA-binding transcriptional regulator [Parasphingorhabdus halotolerans]QJB70264.1 LacI family transcriptional regulator [Parasphingorhabdus halotolerans]
MANPKSRSQPTINDVAAKAGVSKKTVSRVINRSPLLAEATREKVENAIRTLGFVPNPQARALALRRNFLIVLLHDNPNAQTVLNFQTGVLNAIKESDLALVVRPVQRNSNDILHDVRTFLEKQRPLAAMLLPPISERDDLAELCKELGVRYVRIGSAILDGIDNCVASNDQEVVRKACATLIERGHKTIGFVRGPKGFRSALERETGFLAAIADAGINFDKKLAAEGNYRFESGVTAGTKLLSQQPRPTAIFASNDEMAAGVLHAARSKGIAVPEQLSIIGFDDSPTASHIWPPLSTVRWPITEMGELAARKLVPEFLPERDDAELPTILESTFIDRMSVADVPLDN